MTGLPILCRRSDKEEKSGRTKNRIASVANAAYREDAILPATRCLVLKPSFSFLSVGLAPLLVAAACFVTIAAQAAQTGAGAAEPQPETFPVPTNLRVLPKDLTSEQIHTLMVQWTASLGAQCSSCHAEDHENMGPDGRPLLNFAADSKPLKAVARTMFTMTEEINTKYMAGIDNSGVPVTCGTCHRGHLGPEPFVPAPSNEVSLPQEILNESPQSNEQNSDR